MFGGLWCIGVVGVRVVLPLSGLLLLRRVGWIGGRKCLRGCPFLSSLVLFVLFLRLARVGTSLGGHERVIIGSRGDREQSGGWKSRCIPSASLVK